MGWLNFSCLLPKEHRSPIITTFLSPAHPGYSFPAFYSAIKQRGFVIYPGKVTSLDTFRIGTIGDVHPADIHRLVAAVKASMFWREGQVFAEPPAWSWR
jgi:2-aminoethylphosphonate-pyruvate transaminase